MSIQLRIDHLVLEGTALTPRDTSRLQAALGAELAELLQEWKLHPGLAQGIAVPNLPVAAMPLPASVSPSNLGRQIARSLAGSLVPEDRS